MTNLRTVLAAVLALASCHLAACAAPEAGVTSTELTSADRTEGIALREPGAFAESVPQAPDHALAKAEPAALSAGNAEVSAHAFVEDCAGVWSCSGQGALVLRHEGASCLLGEIVLGIDGSTRFRDEPVGALTNGTWTLEAASIALTNQEGVAIRCERQD